MGVRRAGWGLAGLLAVVVLVAAGYAYWRGLPQPLRVGVSVTAPGVSEITEDGLVPGSLRLDFGYLPNADVPDAPTLSAARLDLVDETLGAGVELQPPAPGEWRFETENQLIFTPAEDWPAGSTYRVRLTPELFVPGLRLAASEVEFTTPPFAASMEEGEFVQHPVDVADRRVVASLEFSHPVSRGDLERRLGMSVESGAAGGRSLGYRVEYGPHDRTAHVHSEVVAIPERDEFVTVEVAPSLRPARGDGVFEKSLATEVRIPNRESYFRVGQVNASIVRDEDDNVVQTAVVSFTDQVGTDDFSDHVRAWLLPSERTVGDTTYRLYQWSSRGEVTPDVLAAAEPVEVAVNPTERDVATLQSLVLDVPENRYVFLRVASGLTSAGGFVLAADHEDVVLVPPYPKEAAIAQDGALLPLTGNRRLTLTSRGVSTVRIDIQQIHEGELNHLASQTGGDIRNPWFRGGFSADNISSLTTRFIDVNPGHPRDLVFATLDLTPFLDRGGLFLVGVQGWDRSSERPVGSSDRRMALVTDLGLLAKTNADGSQHAFVHSVATGRPVAGARVELLGRNGVAVRSVTTDERGHARLDSARDLARGRQPTVFVVRHRGDTTFMPYRRGDRQLTWSGFDVGGERVRADAAEELKAALYTDRGLYRPGEWVRLFGIVRRGDLGAVPGAPVELRIDDARRRQVLRTRATLPEDGLLTWDFETRLESPTGRYRANVYLIDEDGHSGRALGGTSFSVEEYQPDRLRIEAVIEGSPEQGWVRPGGHIARVSLENLFGTPARDRRVRGILTMVPVSPVFAGYPEYTFTDPYRDPDSLPRPVTVELDEALTGDDGVARLNLELGQYESGIYRLRFEAEGFEAGGGRGVQAVAGTLLSPADALIGYRADGDLGFIARNAERMVRFVAVGPDAAPASVPGLEAVLLERRFVSALVRQRNGTLAYQSVPRETEIRRQPFALPTTGGEFVLPSSSPGRYALELVSGDGVKLSRVEFAIAGAANLAGNLEREAELDLKLDRSMYRPGDEIVMEISAPYSGAGLITIERERVLAFRWFRSDTNTALARIRVPEDLEGSAYVNVAFVRDINSEEILTSPLSYAVAPFTIDRERRRLDIELDVPELVRPGDELEFRVSTPSPSRLVVVVVDEGILQLAGYETPDPLEAFLGKKALQVATHQMVDLILPDYDVIRRAAAPGGGEAARLLGANLNPFRRRSEPPAAYWLGVLDAGPRTHVVFLPLPDYFNGELRVMAVGVSGDTMGAEEASVTVRGPLVLTPNLPLAVAPTDTFEVSVGVANNLEGSGPGAEVDLAAAPSEALTVEDGTSRILTVAEGGEGRVDFRMRAGEALGAASLTLTGRLGEEIVNRRTEVSVRPAAALRTTVSAGFEADGRRRIDVPRRLHEAHARRRVAASASPLVLVDGMLEYLRTFPHACVEQMVSGVFPQVGLLQSSTFPLDRGTFVEQFRETVTRLRSRQGADGGFRFWVASNEAAPFPSVYVAHFLTDARAFGMAVPDDMLRSVLGYLRRLAEDASGGEAQADSRTRAYAIYVLTRNGVVTTNYLTSLQGNLEREFGEEWRRDIASVYMAASYALLRNELLSDRLIDGYVLAATSRPDVDFDTGLGRDAQYVYLLARHFPERMARLDGEAVRLLVEPLFQDRFNTLSAAYTVLALGEVHRSLAVRDLLTAPSISARGESGPVDVTVTGTVFARASLPVSVKSVDIEADGTGGVYYSVSESGFDVDVPDSAASQGIEIDRVYLDGNGGRANRVRIGEELEVRLRVRSLDGRITNVAVTDLLPGGFEILTESVRGRYGLWTPDNRDVREDRLVIHGSFGERVTEIGYRIKATSPGDFMAPAAHASSMYHRNKYGRSAAGRLVVDRE
jgi:hypothetical protein